MSITDELRDWAKKWSSSILLDVADRIDEALQERYIELHKDIDGEYIHIGDEVQQRNHAGKWTGPLSVMAVTNVGCYVMAYDTLSSPLLHVWGKDVRHYHTPTVEDVLREFGEKYCDMVDGCAEESELFAEYAAKLQLRGDGE